MTSAAKADADAMLSQARANAERLLDEARSRAEGLVSDAATRAEAVVHDARARAETLKRQSQDKIASRPEQLCEHTEIITALGVEKTALENRIEQLSAFEGDYRLRLMRLLQAHLHQLGAPAPAGSADPSSAQQGAVAGGSSARSAMSPPRCSPERRRWAPAVGG